MAFFELLSWVFDLHRCFWCFTLLILLLLLLFDDCCSIMLRIDDDSSSLKLHSTLLPSTVVEEDFIWCCSFCSLWWWLLIDLFLDIDLIECGDDDDSNKVLWLSMSDDDDVRLFDCELFSVFIIEIEMDAFSSSSLLLDELETILLRRCLFSFSSTTHSFNLCRCWMVWICILWGFDFASSSSSSSIVPAASESSREHSLLSLGQMVESKTSMEFFIAWSRRQQSRNSSIVTTPSWFLSIFCVRPFPSFSIVPQLSGNEGEEKRREKNNKLFYSPSFSVKRRKLVGT